MSETSLGSGRLAGKVAVITGAASGIGRATATLFVREGARVVCADISGEEKQTAADLGESAVGVHVDVADPDAVKRMIATAVEEFGRLDVLFNNAGYGGPRGPLTEFDDDIFDRLVAVNLKSVYLGMKYAIPAMLANGGGSVINTASTAGLVGQKGQAVYAAAKGGVVQMTKSVALDFATEGVRVNAICPGMTWTALAHRGVGGPPPADSIPPQPMKRWGLPEEIAAAALFLASDESSFVTGTALPVDGGYVAR
ncbi:SDR family NAD(P)-dependent oxidoreductase [Nocardia noduli]|uniref:SDR family NAD(P)-dependent oxidoreductase n=1 Tax=Nocardia noduli TaxID=2815722 RepID=UPI001C22B46C|nr:SDR family oxidoreductase [Nocardia noduli]